MADDLSGLEAGELESRAESVRERMRPLEREMAALRGERDLILTELRRRERTASRSSRAELKQSIKAGDLLTVAELVASGQTGSIDGFSYNLKTGGEVRLGYPGSRVQSLTFTDGVRASQASDLSQAGDLYAAGWELGSPGHAGVRVHFPGTRQERLIPADEVYARLDSEPGG